MTDSVYQALLQIETLLSGVTPSMSDRRRKIIDLLEGIYLALGGTLPGGGGGGSGNVLMVANNLNDVANPVTALANIGGATPQDITDAIDALKNGVGSAYDTLLEIAAELANNASAHAALVTSIASKADNGSMITALLGKANAGDIANSGINIPTNTIVGRYTSGSGVMEALTLASRFSVSGGKVQLVAAVDDTKTSSFTLTTTDSDILRVGSASAIAITIPTNAAQAFPIGHEFVIQRTGAGAVTFTLSGGVTLLDLSGTAAIGAQNAVVRLQKWGTDLWYLGSTGSTSSTTIVDASTIGKQVLTAATKEAVKQYLEAANLYVSQITKTASFTPALASGVPETDLYIASSSSAIVVTIPTNAAVAFPIGTNFRIYRAGTGAVTLSPSGGVTVRDYTTAMAILKQYGTVMLTKIATNEWVVMHPEATEQTLGWALSDESTALTTGDKVVDYAPFDCTILEVFTGVGVQSSSGVVTTNITKGGTTIFSTQPSIDASEYTSLTGTAAVLSTTTMTKGDRLVFNVAAAGTGAAGLKVHMRVLR